MNYSHIKSSNKKNLVFLPGWGFKSSIWETVTSHLSHFPVIMQDLPTPCQPAFHKDALDDITHEIDKKLPPNSILIAWSLSGLIALDLGLRYPQKYKSIILVASTPRFIKTSDWIGITQTQISAFRAQAATNLPELMQTFQQMIFDSDKKHPLHHMMRMHSIPFSQQDRLLFYLDMLIQSDVRSHCKSVQIPVLHMMGSRDRIIPVNHVKQIKKEYPSHHVHIINEAGHIPFLTHTPEFIDQMLAFLQQHACLA